MSYSIKNVIKGSTIYTIGQLLTKAGFFILIPIYTRYMGPDEYGIIGYLQAVISIISILLLLGAHGIQNRYFYEFDKGDPKFNSLVTTLNILVASFSIIACIFFILAGKYIFHTKFPYSPYFPLTFVTLFFMALNELSVNVLITEKKHGKYIKCQLLQFILITIATLFLVISMKRGAKGQVEGLLFGHFLFFILYYPHYIFKYFGRPKLDWLKDIFSFGFPLVIHGISGALLATVARVIIERLLPMSEVGIYTLAYQLGMVLSIITASINNAWQPNYFEMMATDKENCQKEINRVIHIWLFFLGLICLIGNSLTKDIITLFFPKNYYPAIPLIPFITTSTIIVGLYYFISGPIFFFKKTKFLPIITGVAAIFNVTLNFLFIPIFGIIAAAIISLIASFIQLLLAYAVSQKIFKTSFHLTRIYTSIFLIFLPSVINFHSHSLRDRFYLSTLIIAAYIAFQFLSDKNTKYLSRERNKLP